MEFENLLQRCFIHLQELNALEFPFFELFV